MSVAEFVAQQGAKWTCAQPATPLEWPEPRSVGGPIVDLRGHLPTALPELGVLEVDHATVFGRLGWVSALDEVILRDQCWYGASLEVEVSIVPEQVESTHLHGVTLTLLSDWADVNYGHLLYDSIPRLDLFERAGYSAGDVDHLLCSAPQRLAHYWTEVGLDASRIVWASSTRAYTTDTLLSPSFPGSRRVLPAWAVDFLRARLSVPGNSTGRRLYLRRETSRKLVNERELLPELRKHGFEVLDPGAEASDARAAFAAAEMVVGAHGAALADVVFCPPHGRLLELVPSDHVFPHWYAVSVATGLDYRYLVGKSEGARPSGSLGPSPFDFSVDPHEFAVALDQLVREVEDGSP